MGLFEKKKKAAPCCCENGCTSQASIADGVVVLGSGCAKCNDLEKAAREALAELGMDTTINHVTDFTQIASYGVMSTPALMVDGKVVSYGRVLKKDEAIALIQKARGEQ